MDYWDFNNDTVTDAQNIPLKADYHLPTQLSTPYGMVYYTLDNDVTIESYAFEDVAGINSLCPASTSSSLITLPNGISMDISKVRWLEFGYKHKVLPDRLLCNATKFGKGFENRTLYFPEECTRIGDYFIGAGNQNNYFNSSIVLPQSLTVSGNKPAIGKNFIGRCRIFNKPLHIPAITTAQGATAVYQIDEYFMEHCSSFDSPLTMDSSVTKVGQFFLYSCIAFNQPVPWVSNLKKIGTSFMRDCHLFNQPVTFGSGMNAGHHCLADCWALNSTVDISAAYRIGSDFMASLRAFDSYSSSHPVVHVGTASADIIIYSDTTSFGAGYDSTAAAYTSGVGFEGDNAEAWATKFPSRTTNPYRNTGVYRPYYARVWYLDANDTEQRVDLTTNLDFTQLCNSTFSDSAAISFTNAGVSTTKVAITGVELGNYATRIGNNFMYFFRGLTRAVTIPKEITSIGKYLLSYARVPEITFEDGPNELTIDTYAFSEATISQVSITLPSRIRTISNYFFADATIGNMQDGAEVIVNAISIGTNFLQRWSHKNNSGGSSEITKKLSITLNPGLQSIGDSFLIHLSTYDGTPLPLSLTIPSTVSSIGGNFINTPVKGYDTTDNYAPFSLDLSSLTSLTSIPYSFMASSRSILGNITLPDSVTSVGASFMKGARIRGAISFPVPTAANNYAHISTYNNSFMRECSFDAPYTITIPGYSDVVIGDDFLRECKPANMADYAIVSVDISNCYSIGNRFLYKACVGMPYAVNHLGFVPIRLPAMAQSWGTHFLYDCRIITRGYDSYGTALIFVSDGSQNYPAITNHAADSGSDYGFCYDTTYSLPSGVTTAYVEFEGATPAEAANLLTALQTKWPQLSPGRKPFALSSS